MRQAEIIVDALLEGWLSDRWNDFKNATGIGQDEFGLGKNTEKGWKPKYGYSAPAPRKTLPRKPVRRPPEEPGEKTWDLG